MAITKESTPPPVIGKVGRYTVFLTPPATPKPSDTASDSPKIKSLEKVVLPPPPSETASESPKVKSPKKVVLPPVQPPPQQFDKPSSFRSTSNSSAFGFFWNAIAKVQNAHSSLDEHLADWFGLNQSKYQWALNVYHESRGIGKPDAKPNGLENKRQNV